MGDFGNYLSLYAGKRGWDRNPGDYAPADDGAHIQDSNEQWEWWYFDFSFDNGYKAVVTFHYHNMFLLPHVPTMQLFIYPPKAPPIVKMWAVRPGQENSASRDRCRVRMGDLLAEETDEGYHLVMDMGNLGLVLTVKNDLPGWKAGSGLLWTDGINQTGWVVPVPRGTVSGTLTLEGLPHPVSGTAYHDHNWGNFELEEHFWGWYWGRIFDPNFTLIYGWVIPKETGAPIVSPFLLGKDGKIILGTDQITVTIEESRRDEQFGWEIPQRLRLICHGEGIHVDGMLTTERIVETLRMPRGDEHFYHYYRFLATYQASIEIDGQKHEVAGETLHEFMLLE
jgi:hypothetical protein